MQSRLLAVCTERPVGQETQSLFQAATTRRRNGALIISGDCTNMARVRAVVIRRWSLGLHEPVRPTIAGTADRPFQGRG